MFFNIYTIFVQTQDEELFFIGIWENTIERLRNENGGARYATAEFYDNDLKSFRKILRNEHIDGFHIGLEHIKKWNEGMKNGVADAGRLTYSQYYYNALVFPHIFEGAAMDHRHIHCSLSSGYPV